MEYLQQGNLISFNNAIDKFKVWVKDFETKKRKESEIKGNFVIRKKGIISISLVFIDADTQNGCVLIIPVPWRIPGSERPCFLMLKSHC